MQREEGRLRESAADHRRRTRRAERHMTTQAIHTLEGDELDVVVPVRSLHDVGRKTSSPPKARKPGRREGFKVWKTSYWKRRKALRRDRVRAERLLLEEE